MRIHSPYPASWALAQRIGYLYSEGEIIYLADTPFERLLDIQRQVGQCQTMTSLSQADFEARLEAVFHQNTGESQQIAQDIDQSVDLLSLSEEMPANEDLLNEDSAAPVIRLINAILSEAIKETASDIHIETYEKTMSIRFRIDGVLRTILQPNKKLAALLISRIKVMARLDIAEKRIPQDGRISLRIGRRNIDVRVSTLPSIYGERAVLRLLDKNSLQLSLNNLGMTAADKQDLENLIQLPHGIILVTGPTGSGKSTTLYAILSALNIPGRNILTVEDPVEYELEGIGQTQVNTRVDMSFARGLAPYFARTRMSSWWGKFVIQKPRKLRFRPRSQAIWYSQHSTLTVHQAQSPGYATWASNHSCFHLHWQGLSRNVWFVVCVRNADNSRLYRRNKRRCLNIISSR